MKRALLAGLVAVAALVTAVALGSAQADRSNATEPDGGSASPGGVEQGYAVLRRNATPEDKLATSPAGSISRRVMSDAAGDVFVVWTPGKDVCVVAHVRDGHYGGTACGPEDMATSRPPSLILVPDGSSGAGRLFGVVPDRVGSVVVGDSQGHSFIAEAANNAYTVDLPGTGRAPAPSIVLNWDDGRQTRVVGQ